MAAQGGVQAKEVGTLSRGLLLLKLVNQLHPVRIEELSRAAGLHKATVSRLIGKLAEQGYVVKLPPAGYFYPTSKVHELSNGINHTEWIYEVAAPELDRLGHIVQWPSDFAIFQGRGMSIQYSTRETAPVRAHRSINVYNIPMFDSDFGRALLAWASPRQRRVLLSSLSRANRAGDAAAEAPPDLDDDLERIRRQGYAERTARYRFAKANAIAVGIVVEDRCVGTFNVLSKRRQPEDEMARLYLPAMTETAARIAARLRFDGMRLVRRQQAE